MNHFKPVNTKNPVERRVSKRATHWRTKRIAVILESYRHDSTINLADAAQLIAQIFYKNPTRQNRDTYRKRIENAVEMRRLSAPKGAKEFVFGDLMRWAIDNIKSFEVKARPKWGNKEIPSNTRIRSTGAPPSIAPSGLRAEVLSPYLPDTLDMCHEVIRRLTREVLDLQAKNDRLEEDARVKKALRDQARANGIRGGRKKST